MIQALGSSWQKDLWAKGLSLGGTRKVREHYCVFFIFRSGKIVTRSEFENSVNQGWMSWGFDILVKRPVYWSFSKVFGTGDSMAGEYIALDLLKVQTQFQYYRGNQNNRDRSTVL